MGTIFSLAEWALISDYSGNLNVFFKEWHMNTILLLIYYELLNLPHLHFPYFSNRTIFSSQTAWNNSHSKWKPLIWSKRANLILPIKKSLILTKLVSCLLILKVYGNVILLLHSLKCWRAIESATWLFTGLILFWIKWVGVTHC